MGLIFVRYDFRPKAVLMHIHCCLTVKTAETLAAKDADFVTNDSRSSTSSQTLTQTYDDRHASSLKIVDLTSTAASY